MDTAERYAFCRRMERQMYAKHRRASSNNKYLDKNFGRTGDAGRRAWGRRINRFSIYVKEMVRWKFTCFASKKTADGGKLGQRKDFFFVRKYFFNTSLCMACVRAARVCVRGPGHRPAFTTPPPLLPPHPSSHRRQSTYRAAGHIIVIIYGYFYIPRDNWC